jgi:hypothetical protein
MKKLILILFIISCHNCLLHGQDTDSLKFPLDKMKVNFAVPDIPAFKSLGIEPSTILRPSTPEALSIIVPQFYSQGNITLPSSFALEVSPSLLINANKKSLPTLNQFIKQRALNSLRLSLATGKDSTQKEPKAIKLAVGLRISLINKGDLKYDRGYITKKGLIQADLAVVNFNEDIIYMKRKGIDIVQNQGVDSSVRASTVRKLRLFSVIKNIPLDSVAKDTLKYSDKSINDITKDDKSKLSVEKLKLYNDVEDVGWSKIFKTPDSTIIDALGKMKKNRDQFTKSLKSNTDREQDYYVEQLQAIKEEYKKNKWNAERLDLAISAVWRSPDNFAKSLEYNKLSFWLTYGMPIKQWGQLLFGATASNASLLEESTMKNKNFTQYSISSRLYAGINQMKGFTELQYSYNGFNSSNDYFIHLGGEFAIRDGIWLQVYGGYQKGDKISQVVSSIDLRFSLPEK